MAKHACPPPTHVHTCPPTFLILTTALHTIEAHCKNGKRLERSDSLTACPWPCRQDPTDPSDGVYVMLSGIRYVNNFTYTRTSRQLLLSNGTYREKRGRREFMEHLTVEAYDVRIALPATSSLTSQKPPKRLSFETPGKDIYLSGGCNVYIVVLSTLVTMPGSSTQVLEP